MKYSPDGSTITLEAEARDGWVEVAVTDSGCGIPVDEIAHVRERFYRGSNVGSIPGTGVGLHLVDQIVRGHGGCLRIESEIDRGTRITVVLPINGPGQAATEEHGEQILLVEDDRETASLLAEALTELGYTTDLASDGERGLEAIRSTRPDLVLCDVRMPKIGGFELLERVASAGPAFADIPFIFLTALGDRDSELLGRRLGADDYLTKPVKKSRCWGS